MEINDREKEELLRSGLFSPEWYTETYPDAKATPLEPIDHFLTMGSVLKRSPSDKFDTKLYLRAYPDTENYPAAAVFHYIRYGKNEGRNPYAGTHSKINPSETDYPQRILGKVIRKANRPTILLCAHVASKHLFGSERSFLDILEALSALNYNIVGAVPSVLNRDYLDVLKEKCMSVYSIPYKWWRCGENINEKIVGQISYLISAENISIVHANTIMLREPLEAARRMGIKSVIHVRELIQHDESLLSLIGEDADDIIKEVWSRTDILIANSIATQKAFTSNGRIPYLVYNTADIETLSNIAAIDTRLPLRVGLISSNIPKKGLKDFLDLAKLISLRHPEISCNLIGPLNDYTEEIREKILNGTLPDCINILGYRGSPSEAIAEIDVILSLSTFHESFGRTVLEGMAAGRPAIVYDHGAPQELVNNGHTGFVVPRGDISEVASCISRLANNPKLLSQMASDAKHFAIENFSKENYAAQLKTAYDALEAQEKKHQKLILKARTDLKKLDRQDLKIAYFMWHFPVPSETFVLNELRVLREKGVDVKVFCRHSPHKGFVPDFRIEWEQVTDANDLADKLTQSGRNVVHSHFVFPTVTNMVWPACEAANIPFTFIAHAQDIFRYSNDAQNRVGEIANSPMCKKVFVPSEFHRRYLGNRGVPGHKMMLSANGCDDALYVDGRTPDRYRRLTKHIIAIHRFTEKKGLIHLIRAGKLLQNHGIKISIYGYGDLEECYRNTIQYESISNVNLCGPISNRAEMLSVFRTADLFACPSVRAADGDIDGIPTILMEAMSAGLPVISTSASGIPDLVEDGVTGIIAEASAEAIAESVLRYYNLSDDAVLAIIENGIQRIQSNYNSRRLVEGMLRVWANETIDLMIVSWNNLLELSEVISRIYEHTETPFHLIICDNGSNKSTIAKLLSIYGLHGNVTIILNRENIFVGPGTNVCLQHGISDYAFYICGKEGMITQHGWEIPAINYMNENPMVGQAGTLCYSPSYLHGEDYPNGVPLFGKFRRQEYAHSNAKRIFSHVQGGFFVLRRKMVEEIGGFSTDVPHNYTDVEYSYYIESSGWKIGNAPGILALFNKTRPGIFHRIDEHVGAMHPPTLADLDAIDRIAGRQTYHCNVCGMQSESFRDSGSDSICPHCGSTRRSRSLFRVLAESTLLYRRLTAVAVNLPIGIESFWQQQFQGKKFETDNFLQALRQHGQTEFRSHRLKLALLNHSEKRPISADDYRMVLSEMSRLLERNGVLIQLGRLPIDDSLVNIDLYKLERLDVKRYQSSIVNYDWCPIYIYNKKAT